MIRKKKVDGVAGTEYSGADVYELMRHKSSPDGYKSDWLLLAASRAATAKGVDAKHLSNPELRAIAWFANAPKPESVQDSSNQLANIFLSVWRREPKTVAKVIRKLHQMWDQPGRDRVEQDLIDHADKAVKAGDEATIKRVKDARKRTRPSEEIQKDAASLRHCLPKRPTKRG